MIDPVTFIGAILCALAIGILIGDRLFGAKIVRRHDLQQMVGPVDLTDMSDTEIVQRLTRPLHRFATPPKLIK